MVYYKGDRVCYSGECVRPAARSDVSEGVSEGVNLLMEYIKKNQKKRVPQLAKAIGIPPKTVERWVKQLKEEGKIEFKGSSKKGGYWVKL